MSHTTPSLTPADIDALNQQAWPLQSDLPHIWQLLTHIKEQVETLDYPFGWACYYCNLASYHYFKSNYSEALQTALLAAEQFNVAPASLWKYRFHLRLASIYMYLGLFAESVEHNLLAQKLAEELQLEREHLHCLTSLGATYVSAENYPAALLPLNHALTLLEALNTKYPDLYALCLINLAQTYLPQKEYDKAAECAEKIIKIAPQITSNYDQARMKYAALLTLSEVATHQNKPIQAIKYAENILNTVKNDSRFTQVTLHARQILGQGYLNLKQFAEAEKHLLRGIEEAQEIQLVWFEYQFYDQLSQIYAQQNEYKKAFETHQKFHTLKEQLFQEENQKKVKNLERLYQIQVAQKEAALEAELHQTEQKRQQLADILQEINQLTHSSLPAAEIVQKILLHLNRTH
jgi:tetratricopeptide (TPR) repeat protein